MVNKTKMSMCPIVLLAVLLLSGCQNMTKQDVGTITGGVIGGAIGSQFGGGSGQVAAAIGGTLLGAYIGGSIGRSMDEVDRMKLASSMETARTKQTTTWRNPDTGNSYRVTPQKTWIQADGQPCREFSTVATIGGKKQQMYGTACRDASGAWMIRSMK